MNETVKEVWVEVPGFEGRYQVSNLGRVKAMRRLFVRQRNGYKPHIVTIQQKILTPQVDNMGYTHVRLKTHGYKTELFKTHQVVCMAFLGHDRKNRNYVIHHINHNKQDNRLINLQVQLRAEHCSKHKRGLQ